jgi:NDP-sugar pyrophosphorylase family protein
VVADGTSVPVVDIADLLARHRAAGAAITAVADAHSSGRMRPSGLYVFDRRALAHVAPEGFQDIKEKLVPALYAAGEPVAVHVAEGGAPRVVNADTYLALNHWLVEQASRRRDPPEGFRCAGETMLHHGARVDPTARLLGPLLLGAGVEVGEGATLVGPMSVGPHTTIGKGAVVSRSVLCSGCVVGSQAFVDRSMLSDQVIVPSRGSVVSALQTRAPRADRPRPRVGQMLWQPVQGILRLAAPHDA